MYERRHRNCGLWSSGSGFWRPGDWVKKNDIIARLDPMQLQQQRLRDQGRRSSAQSNYRQMQTSIANQKATLESDIAARRAELNEAQAKLDALLNGSRKEDIEQSRVGGE